MDEGKQGERNSQAVPIGTGLPGDGELQGESNEEGESGRVDDLTLSIRRMHLHLDEFPDDWNSRLVLSDMLLDAGEIGASNFQRELVRRKKRPQKNLGRTEFQFDERWDWWAYFDISRSTETYPDSMSMVAGPVHHEMIWKDEHKYYMPTFPSRQKAEAALMKVWLKGKWVDDDTAEG